MEMNYEQATRLASQLLKFELELINGVLTQDEQDLADQQLDDLVERFDFNEQLTV